KQKLTAVTRAVSPSLADCELTLLARQKIDVAKAIEQRRGYEECLSRLGACLVRLPAEPDLPDSVFVEDTAIVLDVLAVITRPGATSRRAEMESVADALTKSSHARSVQSVNHEMADLHPNLGSYSLWQMFSEGRSARVAQTGSLRSFRIITIRRN